MYAEMYADKNVRRTRYSDQESNPWPHNTKHMGLLRHMGLMNHTGLQNHMGLLNHEDLCITRIFCITRKPHNAYASF